LNFFEKLVAAVRKTILGELFYRMFWLWFIKTIIIQTHL
jgi:hypothetical protein